MNVHMLMRLQDAVPARVYRGELSWAVFIIILFSLFCLLLLLFLVQFVAWLHEPWLPSTRAEINRSLFLLLLIVQKPAKIYILQFELSMSNSK